jgi:prevent-host-death family protein
MPAFGEGTRLGTRLDLAQFAGYKMVMIWVNIHEAKTHLSRYLERVAKGESIVLCRRNVPIAEIRPITRARRLRRPVGLAKGAFLVPPEFFEPLPADVVGAFSGETR